MKTFTVDNIMDLGPRYPRERVAALFAGRRRLSLRQILALRIPSRDRVWVAVRLLPSLQAQLFAADCAEHVLPIFERAHPGDDRPRKAIETARRYARGEATEKELGEARKAARAAAYAAANAVRSAYQSADAAYQSADAAHWAVRAATDAAHWSAWHAADAADAADAAYRAAGAAERKWQVKRLRVYAKELEAA